jgi:DNA polymerase-1
MVFYLIDGTAICYRAYYAYATKNLQNSKGLPTNVPYGFLLILKKLLGDYKPDGIMVAFDVKGPTFRHEKLDTYKANRKPTPEDLISQVPYVKKIVEGFRIPVIEKQGYEADDVMGTIAVELRDKGHEVIIVTSDKDICQLVGDRISVMDPGKDYAVLGPMEVREKLGVAPDQVVDYLAMVGDASDNIPGVPGIGPKTAVELIGEFGTLDGVYRNLDKIKGVKQRNLQENEKTARLAQELATIDCAVPLHVSENDLKLREPDMDALKEIYKELEFKSFLKELPHPTTQDSVETQYHLVASAKEWKGLLAKLHKVSRFSLDFETTGVDALNVKPVGLSFSFQSHEAYFVLFDIHASGRSELAAADVLADLKPILEDPGVKKIGQNIKYEMMVLKAHGIELKGEAFDTMVASYLLNPSKSTHNLGELAAEHLDERLVEIESLIGTGKKQITMAEADLDKLYRYGCQDSDVVWRLAGILEPKIADSGMTDLFEKIEMPLIRVLCDMETAGIAVDVKFLEEFSARMEKEIAALTIKIHKTAGGEFNINSPKQLAEILFDRLKLPHTRKTKTGYTTDASALEELASMHELPAQILDYRELAKLKSTYVDPLPEMRSPRDRRIHTSYNQTVTATGRLSSSDPNLQNIPIRTEEGREVRRAFVAPKGSVLLSADYSQIELRILAHMSGDPNLTRAFADNQDVHAYTASLVFGVELAEVTPQMRDQAKTVNFGVLYGMGPFGLARSLKISQEAARDFIKAYFERYPKIKSFMDDTLASARSKGYVETLLKRRRYIPDIESKDMRMRQFAERTAINAPVQGTASDLIKIAMVSIHERLQRPDAPAGTRMLLQVHDDLVFEVPEKSLTAAAELVRQEMENAIKLSVPVLVSVKAGPNWKEMEKLKIR